jgi:hypothetical protein
LLTAIYGKTISSALSTAVGGRIYLDEAPQKTGFPYVVFSIVSSVPDKTFTENFEDILIQFSLFSASKAMDEITNIYTHLNTLFDECSLTITNNILLRMTRENLTTMFEDIITPEGKGVRHWAVDYSILIEKS